MLVSTKPELVSLHLKAVWNRILDQTLPQEGC